MPYVSIQDALKQNPDFVKQNYPNIYSQYTQQVEQPGASLQNTQTSTEATAANIPGIQAESGIKTVQQQQTAAPQMLAKDLANGMTLPMAIKKYSALQMSPDDIFTKYLSQSHYGIPKESPTMLKNMGISDKALGQPGEIGSFMDRWNTRNAVEEMRNLKDLWHHTDTQAKLPFLSGYDTSAAAYQTAKNALGEHLTSLIPGAPSAQASSQTLANSLPNVGDTTQLTPGKAGAQFQSLEKQLLTQKGYNYKDLGIAPDTSEQNNASGSGSNLLHAMLGTAKNVTQDINAGVVSRVTQGERTKASDQSMQQAKQMEDEAIRVAKTNPQLSTQLHQQAQDILSSNANEAKTVANTFSKDVTQNPLTRSLEASSEIVAASQLPFLAKGAMLGGGSKALSGILGNGGKQAAEGELPKITGNPIIDLLNPKNVVTRGGNYRTAVVNAADKAGKTISGSDILTSLKNWADTAKAGNLGQGGYIDTAISDADKALSGKSFKPSDIAKIYSEADSGYTKTGIAKTPIQANIDRGLRDILGQKLEESAPGWQKATQTMAKGYQAQKSGTRKFAGRAAAAGLGIAGLDELRRVIGIGG